MLGNILLSSAKGVRNDLSSDNKMSNYFLPTILRAIAGMFRLQWCQFRITNELQYLTSSICFTLAERAYYVESYDYEQIYQFKYGRWAVKLQQK